MMCLECKYPCLENCKLEITWNIVTALCFETDENPDISNGIKNPT